ncbi:hypothetical protein ACHWQZ_G008817 [Mnemiopsis leidyi]
MGNCLLRNRCPSSRNQPEEAKNQPVKSELPVWSAERSITTEQLMRKRAEFWDTSPAYEGRKEIWDALKAAAEALETGNRDLAQAILDGASITLPSGFLSDCYDELGCRYVLPPYVLSRPTNIVTTKPEPSSEPVVPTSPVTMAPDMYLKIRLSIGDATSDEKLPVNSLERIADVKERIRQNHNFGLSRIRMICCGKILNDKTAIKDAKIPKSFIVQVIVSTDLE